MQHMIVAGGLAKSPQGEELSDHRPVIAEFNTQAPHCGPASSFIISEDMFENPWGNTRVEGNEIGIRHPEGAQWFLVTEPGTYSIAVQGLEGTTPEIEIYSSRNISEPIGQYRDLETPFIAQTGPERTDLDLLTGGTFAFPSHPFFIKVTMPEFNTGRFSITIHKHRGVSPADAIVLFPNQDTQYNFNARHNENSTNRFFRIDTEGPLSGESQRLTFSAAPRSDTDVRIALINEDGSTRAPIELDGQIVREIREDNFSTFYFVVQPQVRIDDTLFFDVGWHTNLQVLTISQEADALNNSFLTVVDETAGTNVGKDGNIKLNFFADGVQFYPTPEDCGGFGTGCITEPDRRPNLGDFNKKPSLFGGKATTKAIDPFVACSIGFLSELTVELTEDDVNADDILTGQIRGSALLARSDLERLDQNLEITGGKGRYNLNYSLARGTQSDLHGLKKPTSETARLFRALPCNRNQ